MRLFLALRLPTDVIASVEKALAGVRDRRVELRWIPPERWHLTLAFFGEVAEREVAALHRRLTRRLAAGAAMNLQLRGAGRFGDRVLWLGVAGDVEQLRSMGERVAVDNRPYRPHLTVARAKQRADLRELVDHLGGYAGPTWRAGEVELIESQLGPRPTYQTLNTWVLPDRTGDR